MHDTICINQKCVPQIGELITVHPRVENEKQIGLVSGRTVLLCLLEPLLIRHATAPHQKS